MRILSYLNVSNIDDIESDSGYIFNYTLAREFVKRGHSFHIILPLKLERTQTRFLNDMVSYINMGTTKYESRYHFEWMDVLHVIEKYHPDIVLLNQVELTATFRVLLHSTGHEAVKIFTYCHYPATHIDADTKDVILDYTLNDYCLGENIIYNILTSINVSDVFAIQSVFARDMLLEYAKKHNITINKMIEIIPPPYDEQIYQEPRNQFCNEILYNHRLYDSYGTAFFIDFVADNPDLSFIVTDPMSNRGEDRSKFNKSPQHNKQLLAAFSNVAVVDGGNREKYIEAIDKCRLAVAPYRTACVWSMSIIDCYCRGIPVIGPNIASFSELIPHELLFNSSSEEKALVTRLINDEKFWRDSIRKCRQLLPQISPAVIVEKIIKTVS